MVKTYYHNDIYYLTVKKTSTFSQIKARNTEQHWQSQPRNRRFKGEHETQKWFS